MNFGFSEEQDLLRRTARDFLAEHAPMTRVREVMDGDAQAAREIWRSMSELGWPGLAFPEGVGGVGMSMVELCVVLEELGRSLAPVPFLPTMLAGIAILEAGDAAQRREWLPCCGCLCWFSPFWLSSRQVWPCCFWLTWKPCCSWAWPWP